jgi:hypothetical protein
MSNKKANNSKPEKQHYLTTLYGNRFWKSIGVDPSKNRNFVRWFNQVNLSSRVYRCFLFWVWRVIDDSKIGDGQAKLFLKVLQKRARKIGLYPESDDLWCLAYSRRIVWGEKR